MPSCCSVIGLVFLVVTNLAIIISFATPYWVDLELARNQGLWAICHKDSCTWVFEEGFSSTNTRRIDVEQSWWVATQGLTCFGLALGLFSFLLATIALCCECRSCNTNHAIGGLLVMCFIALGAAATVFGVCANKFEDIEMKGDVQKNIFGWSFWLNAAAAGMALLTSAVYVIEGRGKYA